MAASRRHGVIATAVHALGQPASDGSGRRCYIGVVPFDHDLIGTTLGPYEHPYTWRDVALYALGCGATTEELDLVLETRGPKVLLTFSVAIVGDAVADAIRKLGGNMLTLVHGSQRCTMHSPLPAKGTLRTTCIPSALYDKKKGALAHFETRTVDENDTLLFETEWQIFYRGEGGFGGPSGPKAESFGPDEGAAADHRVVMPIAPTQALLYRLSGDLNPIHSDPEVAAQAGFPQPILHGLCTFGHAARAAVQTLCDGDPDRLTEIQGRFSRPVFPGDVLITELFSSGSGEAYFTSRVEGRDDPVLTLGRVRFRS